MKAGTERSSNRRLMRLFNWEYYKRMLSYTKYKKKGRKRVRDRLRKKTFRFWTPVIIIQLHSKSHKRAEAQNCFRVCVA